MDSQSRQDSLRNAWRALAVTGETQGWCTINIDEAGLCRAGMHLDDNEEAILFGFEKNSFSNLRSFPKGYGFSVIPVDLPFPEHNKTWVALVRNRSGNMAMFTLMAVDVLSAVERHVSNKLTDSFELFVRRVRAWQNFMRVGNSGILSPEDEIGLFGELLFLQELIQTGLPLDIAIRSWRGPSGDVHDFSLGSGAVEVKTTSNKGSFMARISSLQQLDDSIVAPLYLCAIRLQIQEDGHTLPELVESVAGLFVGDNLNAIKFCNRILSAGYHADFANSYHRRFGLVFRAFYVVDAGFPRLIAGNVPSAVTKVTYYVNLDGLIQADLPTSLILESTGVWS